MVSYLLVALIGLILGGGIGLLADWLPNLSRDLRGDAQAQEAEPPDKPADVKDQWYQRFVRPRYIAVELGMAIACLYLWHREGLTPMLGILAFYVALFILIAVIDIEHRLVLDVVMLPAFVIALLEIVLSNRIALQNALVGFAVGQIVVMGFYVLGIIYLWVINAGRKERIREVAFGFGDVTLATFCGLVVGYPRVVVMLVLMVALGGVIALLYLLYRAIVVRQYKAHTPLPYGPSIVLAAVVMLVWGSEIGRLLGAQ
jgi:prepilin signal peptidase PulO-like enzyme (type II secretory pathway)